MAAQLKTVLIAAEPSDLAATLISAVQVVPGFRVVQHSSVCEVERFLTATENEAGLILLHSQTLTDQIAILRLLNSLKAQGRTIPVVVVAESELEADRSKLLDAGAAECLFRPLNLSRLSFLVDFLTIRSRSVAAAVEEKQAAPAVANLIFESEQSQVLLKTARRMSQVDSNVLLTGETGTGKTCLARMIHDLSPRRRKPFIVVNCGSIPESLLESELFGHGQGAFTGADRDHRGKFAQAGDGTIFFDEIDSLPLSSQASLLRVVEERAYEPVGSGKSMQVPARFIFATNRDLSHEVEVGRFRQDLYFRVNVVTLEVPTLRARLSALPQLVALFLSTLRGKGMTIVEKFSTPALEQLALYNWPGNIRELRNVVERIAVLAERSVVEVDQLPDEIIGTRAMRLDSRLPALIESKKFVPSLRGARKAAERDTIITTLASCSDNRTMAAELLGISRAAFYKKLQQLGIA
jgi:DNA-binding NtrC family response regulator